jgi:hypothetical protein
LADPATNPTSTSLLMSLCMHEDSVLFGGEVQVSQIIFVGPVWKPVLWNRIRRIHMFLGLQDPDPSIIKQK